MTKRSITLASASLATLLAIFAPTPLARADIFQWEYINPANPSEGKQESTMLTLDGEGANAVPGADLSSRNLTMAYLRAANLNGANLSHANLTNALLFDATLTSTNLNGAEVRGADFFGAGITLAQLYSTASYQAHDLTAIGLPLNNLAGANLAGQNLTNARFHYATLTGANLSHANLTGANFDSGNLTGANLTGAEVRGAKFANIDGSAGITVAQLFSTASYQARDLTGISLRNIDLTGASLAGFNLTNARFEYATLTNADLSEANLTNANFDSGDLTGANLTGAEVRGSTFGYYGIKKAQLYSTASYQAHDLTGIRLWGSQLAGANLAGQNLTNASLGGANLVNADLSQANLTGADFFFPYYTGAAAVLTGANLSQANLTNANFSGSTYPIYDEYGEIIGTGVTPGAHLTDANLSGADARGANFQYATLTGANTSNLIQSNGHIAGLDLPAGASLVVRDYDGIPVYPPTGPLPIVVEQHLAMDATGTLQLAFDADPWDSTISFAPGILVTLGGTLDLAFAPGVDVATQSGRTIDLFDWTGVTPTGTFTVSSPYTWNLSNLYTTGEVTLTAVPSFPGDFNHDGTVDAADYIVWRKTGGSPDNHNTWRANFGATAVVFSEANAAVPEPASLALLALGLPLIVWRKLRRSRT